MGTCGSKPDEGTEQVGKLTDSPWFWAYLFCTAGLIALYLAGPRYRDRQPQLERQFSARQSGGQAISGANGPVKPSPEQMIIPLQPLYLILSVLLAIAWMRLWYHRFRARPAAASSDSASARAP